MTKGSEIVWSMSYTKVNELHTYYDRIENYLITHNYEANARVSSEERVVVWSLLSLTDKTYLYLLILKSSIYLDYIFELN